MRVLCMSVALLVLAGAVAEDALPWWKTTILYQVYPRSFKDSDGDGVGDLKGITQKASYFKDIGVDAIWISPIFMSPMLDFGYDISDFREIDPLFGSIDDFKQLVNTLKNLGIKILLDLVPNHSSDQHQWFKWSVQKKDPYTDYYVWVDGKFDPKQNKTVEPNNWLSRFEGSAWEWVEERQQYYLHNFLKEQPDLNYRNLNVVKEMDGVIQYWLDIGVDGFRVDAVPWLVEDPELRDEPVISGSGKAFFDLDHIYTENRPETYAMCQHWADYLYNYSQSSGREVALFLEAYADLNQTIMYYGHGNESLMVPFNFFLQTDVKRSSRPLDLYNIIYNWITNITSDDTSNWVVGNHDRQRVSEMFGPETVDAINLLTGVLPGVKVTYYGEEIGMQDTFVRWDQTVDAQAIRMGQAQYIKYSRDPFRSPMQWDSSTNAGFSASFKTWLPVNPNYWWLNVEAQNAADTSHLKVFKTMALARQDPILQRGNLTVKVPDPDTLLVIRTYKGSWYTLIINMGSTIADYTTYSLFAPQGLDSDMTVVGGSINSGIPDGQSFKKGNTAFSLRPRAAVLLRSGT